MNDMTLVIIAKSDQINADDLLAGPRTITISSVTVDPGIDQPVTVSLEGGGKVYRPGKSMRRVLVQAWGPDASAYAGRSLTLYRDPDVKFGGMDVGGIRISKMSHIPKRMVMALTATRGNKKPFVVEPLVIEKPAAAPSKVEVNTRKLLDRITEAATPVAVHALVEEPAMAEWLAKLAKARPDLHAQVQEAIEMRIEALRPVPDADEAPPAAEPAAADDGFGSAFA